MASLPFSLAKKRKCSLGLPQSPPLFVLEFLHRVADVFIDYFGSLKEGTIRDNFSTVYQVCGHVHAGDNV